MWDPEHENLLKKKLDAFGEPIEPEETKGKPKRKGLLKVLGKELNPKKCPQHKWRVNVTRSSGMLPALLQLIATEPELLKL